eukprot:7539887-Heterocapsa_arctica.AAC.1
MPGPPLCYIWGTLILALLKACEGKSSHQAELQVLANHAQKVNAPLDLQQYVHVCEIYSAYLDGWSKITIAISPKLNNQLSAVISLCAALDFKVKYGTPPKGPTERLVEQALRKFGAID